MTDYSKKEWEDYFNKKVELFGDSPKANAYFNRISWRNNYKILDLIDIKDKVRILDVGCGSGLFVSHLINKNIIYGLDISFKMVKLAKMKGIYALKADVESIPFRSNFFDVVLCHGIIQYLNNLDKIITELSRVTQCGGQVIISFLNRESLIRFISGNLLKFIPRQEEMRPKAYSVRELFEICQVKNLIVKTCLILYNPLPFYSTSRNINWLYRFGGTTIVFFCQKTKDSST